MDSNSLVPSKDQKEKPSLLSEVFNLEKQLFALIHAKGPLHSDVQNLHRKVCSGYEKILLNDHTLAELQDIEYSLWKLHYKHIDEFRKRMKKNSANEESMKFPVPQSIVASQGNNDSYTVRIKSFLSEATEFYQNLIGKIRRHYGVPDNISLSRSSGESASGEPKKMQKLLFLCQRFLVCCGDLARYREQCEKADIKNQNWSLAVNHYLEATMIWPDGGNPQNQLAVLATYVGDDFLALYHCIRSLAVKEPFPDAWNNLILLFERNGSSNFPCLSSQYNFDFSKPSENSANITSQSSNGMSNAKAAQAKQHEGSGETHLWSLIIRMISFFFIKFSLEDFSHAFASTIKELDVLMTLDDAKLKAALESYQLMDSARSGPFRVLQVVAIFIFSIEKLINSPEVKDSKNKIDPHHPALQQSAVTATFIFMGRFVDRCLKANSWESCPILPALLVFVEWLASTIEKVEELESDDKSTRAMSYFFGTLLELLKKFDVDKLVVKPSISIALWEDYELRGFSPLAHSHSSLDFSTHWGHAASFESGTECRAERLMNAARKIADRPKHNQKWIMYDKSARKFYAAESNKFANTKESGKTESAGAIVEVIEPQQHIQNGMEESEKLTNVENLHGPRALNKSVAMEEEEVILFKPLTRYNSAPLYSLNKTDEEVSPKEAGEQTVPADECLRRATSLLIAQNPAQGNPLAFHSDLTSFRCGIPPKQQEPLVQDTMAYPFSEASISPGPPSFSTSITAGPPSLNAWVLGRGSLSNVKSQGKSDMIKHSLTPIQEIPSTGLSGLSISEAEDSVVVSGQDSVGSHYSYPVYSNPVPSAPFLPDNAVWFNGIQSTYSDYNVPGAINRANSLFDASQASGYTDWTNSHHPLGYGSGIPGLVDRYPPNSRMTSSEWLRQFRESHKHEPTTNHIWPAPPYTPGNTITGNFYSHDISRTGLFDRFGTPLASNALIYEGTPTLLPGFSPVYATNEHNRLEKPFNGYQRSSSYVSGAVNEPQPLLHYLKEKEWLLHQDPALRGPTYMGS